MSDAVAGGSAGSGRPKPSLWKQLRRPLFDFYVRICPLPPLLLLVSPRNRKLLREMRAIHRARAFDADWYRQRYPDAVPLGMDPLEHFCRYGWRRGLDPNPRFAVSLYLIRHPEGAASNPLLHALQSMRHHRADAAPEPLQPQETFANADRWYDAATPALSIVILNFNKGALTRECLRSVWRHTAGCRYEIIVVDNGSAPADVALLAEPPGRFRLLPLAENRFFGEGNNIGVEEARGELLCLMNNDVFVTPHWLEPLLEVLRTTPDCGAVGPRFLYPDGRTQEVGAMVDAAGQVRRLGHGVPAEETTGLPVQPVDYVSAATVLMRRTVYEAVLGFDAAWEPAYYEDTDLCFKIAAAGLRTYCCPQSAVIHHESVTTSDSGHGLRLTDIKEINRAKFQERWPQHPPAPSVPSRSAGWAGTRDDAHIAAAEAPTVALFTRERLAPSGTVRYLLAIAEVLQHGYRVCVVTPERYSRLRLQAVARDLGLGRLDAVTPLSLQAAQALPPFALCVMIADEAAAPGPQPSPQPSPQLSPALAAQHSLLVARACPASEPPAPGSGAATRAADTRLVIEDAAPDVAARLAVLTPPIAEIAGDRQLAAPKPAKPRTILHVGRFLGDERCKNQHRLIAMFRMLCRAEGTACDLHLAGVLPPEAEHRAYYRRCRELAAGLPVHFHLDAPRDRLDALYRRAHVYWPAPPDEPLLADAAGPATAASCAFALREAMAGGCLVIALQGAAAATVLAPGLTGIIARDGDKLIAETMRALQDPDAPELAAIRIRAAAAACRSTRETFATSLQGVLQRLAAPPRTPPQAKH